MRKSVCVCAAGLAVCALCRCSATAASATWYVWGKSPTNGPGTTWTTAFHTIQPALTAAGTDDTVLVTNGYYRPLTELVLTKRIVVVSVNGADKTWVDGDGTHRVFRIATNAVLDGFTITNGHIEGAGGGVHISGGGTMRNCLITGNRAGDTGFRYGGGVFLTDTGLVERCVFRGNSCNYQGGGAWVGYRTTLRNCLFYDNTAGQEGGGIFCYQEATVENCTVTGNKTGSFAAGISCYTYDGPDSVVRNTIVYANPDDVGLQNHYVSPGSVWMNCCTRPAVGGACVTNAPRFVSPSAGDYRLKAGSPCYGRGLTLDWMPTATDLAGQPRIMGSRVDIGAYESAAAPGMPWLSLLLDP